MSPSRIYPMPWRLRFVQKRKKSSKTKYRCRWKHTWRRVNMMPSTLANLLEYWYLFIHQIQLDILVAVLKKFRIYLKLAISCKTKYFFILSNLTSHIALTLQLLNYVSKKFLCLLYNFLTKTSPLDINKVQCECESRYHINESRSNRNPTEFSEI